ncbi:MAG: amino acid-binding protein [Nitrososphaerota archaeon]|nr:amino acid-binding protein [Nitrososphaerota archaeon]
MWRKIEEKFYRQKSRAAVAKKMIELGIRIGNDLKLYVGDVAVGDVALARSLNVDRRVIRKTVNQIMNDDYLRDIFTRITPVGASFVNIAERLGWSVLVIAADPHRPGVIAGVTSILAKYGVVIRQALADDPDLVAEPRLTLIVEGKVPPEAIDQIKSLDVVKSLTLLKGR